jgi:sugar fermentation stimulation protein A
MLDEAVRTFDIPWAFLEQEVQDRGSYLLLLRLRREKTIQVGSLGRVSFPVGYYLYVGSAMQGLTARIAWHRRREKAPRWHIDYLRRQSDEFLAIPIRSSLRQECDVACAFAGILEAGPSGFGSSDCRCPTHLFRSSQDPLRLSSFHTVLQRFRMRPPLDLPGT